MHSSWPAPSWFCTAFQTPTGKTQWAGHKRGTHIGRQAVRYCWCSRVHEWDTLGLGSSWAHDKCTVLPTRALLPTLHFLHLYRHVGLFHPWTREHHLPYIGMWHFIAEWWTIATALGSTSWLSISAFFSVWNAHICLRQQTGCWLLLCRI